MSAQRPFAAQDSASGSSYEARDCFPRFRRTWTSPHSEHRHLVSRRYFAALACPPERAISTCSVFVIAWKAHFV
jgi:hypothetical protein